MFCGRGSSCEREQQFIFIVLSQLDFLAPQLKKYSLPLVGTLCTLLQSGAKIHFIQIECSCCYSSGTLLLLWIAVQICPFSIVFVFVFKFVFVFELQSNFAMFPDSQPTQTLLFHPCVLSVPLYKVCCSVFVFVSLFVFVFQLISPKLYTVQNWTHSSFCVVFNQLILLVPY